MKCLLVNPPSVIKIKKNDSKRYYMMTYDIKKFTQIQPRSYSRNCLREILINALVQKEARRK